MPRATLSLITFYKNAIDLDYPMAEWLAAHVPVADEVLVCDGGSTDGTLAALQAYAADHPTVRVLQYPWPDDYHELARLVDWVAAQATSDYVLQAQGDEILHEDDVPKLQAFLDQAEALSLGAGNVSVRSYIGNFDLFSDNREGPPDQMVRLYRNRSFWHRPFLDDHVEGGRGEMTETGIRLHAYSKVNDLATAYRKEVAIQALFTELGFPDPRLAEMKRMLGHDGCDYFYILAAWFDAGRIHKRIESHPAVMDARIAAEAVAHKLQYESCCWPIKRQEEAIGKSLAPTAPGRSRQIDGRQDDSFVADAMGVLTAGMGSLIDVGCGDARQTGGLGLATMVFTDVVRRDTSPEPLITVSADKLSSVFVAGSFDAVSALDVLEHLRPAAAADALSQMEAIGRRVILFTPLGPWGVAPDTGDPAVEGDPMTHKSGWYPDTLTSRGYQVVVLPEFHLFAPGSPEYAIADASVLGAILAWRTSIGEEASVDSIQAVPWVEPAVPIEVVPAPVVGPTPAEPVTPDSEKTNDSSASHAGPTPPDTSQPLPTVQSVDFTPEPVPDAPAEVS